MHAPCLACATHPQLRSLEISHCTALAMLLVPAMAPAAAALVSGGYTAEAAHGVVVHGLRGPMEVSRLSGHCTCAMCVCCGAPHVSGEVGFESFHSRRWPAADQDL